MLPWIADRSLRLDALSNKGSVSRACHASEAATLAAQLVQALMILQGIILNHASSKQYCGRRSALEVRRSRGLTSWPSC